MVTNKSLEEVGEKEMRKKLSRGDYVDSSEISSIEYWLRLKDAERLFNEDCERANRSAALDSRNDARKANIAATVATVAATVAAICAVVTLIKTP